MSKSLGGRIGWFGLIIIMFIGYLLWRPVMMVIGIGLFLLGFHHAENQMQRAETYIPVATNLALFCQSYRELGFSNQQYISGIQLPPPLPSLGHSWAFVGNTSMLVEFGGGFYHYGYVLELNSALCTPGTNAWELFLEREGQPNKFLFRVMSPKSERMSMQTFVSNAIAASDQSIANSHGEIRPYQQKIAFLLKYAPAQARVACVDAINKLPHHWWPRLTLALMDAGKGRSEGEDAFVKYVEKTPGYSRYSYLAYFYQLTHRPKEAARAIDKAISFPIIDTDDDDGNSECRGYTLGVYAFHNHEYETLIKLCDVLLPVQINGDYAKNALTQLKSAARTAMNGSKPSFSWDDNVLPFNPYKELGIRVDLLLKE